jgi:hypothetical protein
MRPSSQRPHKSLSKTRLARARGPHAARPPAGTLTLTIGANLERCIFCAGTHITRRGRRYKQHEILQRWHCHSCDASFSPRTASKGSTYPLKVILETLCRFYQGHTIPNTTNYIRGRFGLTIHPRTISR